MDQEAAYQIGQSPILRKMYEQLKSLEVINDQADHQATDQLLMTATQIAGESMSNLWEIIRGLNELEPDRHQAHEKILNAHCFITTEPEEGIPGLLIYTTQTRHPDDEEDT